MTDDRSLERTDRSWLEAGPTRAPDQIVQLALDRIQATPQDHVWPRPRLGRRVVQIYGVATGFAVIGVVLLGGIVLLQRGTGPGPAISPAITSPATSAPATMTPSPSVDATSDAGGVPVLTKSFVSPQYGYSVVYPGDWTPTPATMSWAPGVVLQWGSPALDELRGATARFVGASQPLRSGQTPDQWLEAFGVGSCLGLPANWHPVAIGSATGLIDADGCDAPGAPLGKGGQLFDAVVVTGGRAYDFTMDGQVSHADFVAVLATITLDPASAVGSTASP